VARPYASASFVLVLVLVLACAACAPGTLDETGKLCTASRPCGHGFVCTVSGVCASVSGTLPDGGLGPSGLPTANLLVNPGFEQSSNSAVGWTSVGAGVITVDGSSVHSGSESALITGTGAVGITPSTAPVSQTSSGQIFCATAWVANTSGPAQLVLVEGPPGGQQTTQGSPENAQSSTWTKVIAVSTAAGLGPLTLQVNSNGIVESFNVDDVALWQASSTACTGPAG
jgi:hypothetical protein